MNYDWNFDVNVDVNSEKTFKNVKKLLKKSKNSSKLQKTLTISNNFERLFKNTSWPSIFGHGWARWSQESPDPMNL